MNKKPSKVLPISKKRSHSKKNISTDSFLLRGGKMGKLIRAFDWTKTSLGPIASWPQSLKTAVSIVLHSPVPLVMLWGKDGVMIYNDAYSVFAGKRHPALLGSKVVEGWPEVADFNRNVMKYGLQGKTLSYKDQTLTLYRNTIAEEVSMDLNYSPIMDESGSPAGVLAIVVETTAQVQAARKQKQAEEAVRKSEEAYRTLFNSMEEGFCTIEVLFNKKNKPVDYRFLDVNPAFEKQTGIKNAEGKLMRDIAPKHEQHWFDIYGKIALTGKSLRFENQAEQLHRWYEVYAFRVGLPENRRVGIIFNDITARKLAQKTLQESEEQAQETSILLKTILDTAPVGFCLFDANLRYKIINQMLADINGFTPEEHKGKTIEEIIPSVNEDVTRELKKVLKTGKPILGLELTGETKNQPGVTKHWRVDYFPVRSSKGKIIGVGVLVIDVTERKLQESHKDEFLGIASHELKTPVTSLKAFGQVIQNRLAKEGNEKAVILLAKMDAQINKLTSLIQDLLDISKIEGGRLQFHNDFFAFDELVDEVVEELQRTTEKHNLITKGKTGKTLYGDRERIGQVITNFLTNAIKYSPHNEKIIIKTSTMKQNIKLCVEDFGVGIPKDNIPHLFERYYRVKGKTHDTVPGMGIGLYIASEIIRRQGGRIWAESEKGKGSIFCFTLPLKVTGKVQQKNTLVKEEMKHE